MSEQQNTDNTPPQTPIETAQSVEITQQATAIDFKAELDTRMHLREVITAANSAPDLPDVIRAAKPTSSPDKNEE